MDETTEVMIHHERWRVARVVMYSCLVLAGICATCFPSQLVQTQVGITINFLWASGLAISGCICLYGAVTDQWIGEYTGLPLLFSVIGLYGLSALLGAGWNPSPLFAYSLLTIGFSAGLIARWQDVRDSKRRADEDRGTIEEE